jgi:prolyl oligopeptidase
MIACLILVAAAANVPATPKKAEIRKYQGIAVRDDYAWLEMSTDPKVKQWSNAQNDAARAFLDNIPGRAPLQQRLETLLRETFEASFAITVRGGRFFAFKFEPHKQQPYIALLADPDHSTEARTLLDPDVLDPSGHTSIDFFVPSLDGTKLAVSLSKGGSEAGDLHVYDVATGREIDAPVAHVYKGTAGGSVAWTADGKGFFYTRYPRQGERPAADLGFYQQVYFHAIGSTDDRYELGKDLPRIAEIALESTPDGKFVLASVKNGDGGDAEFFVRGPARWSQISTFADRLVMGQVGVDGAAYFLSRMGTPRGKLVRIPLDAPELSRATEVVPQGEGAIEFFAPARDRLFVVDILGGPSRVRAFPLGGGEPQVVATPDIASVDQVEPLDDGSALLYVQTYLAPGSYWHATADGAVVSPTQIAMKSIADYSDCEAVRGFAVSKDGTKVPFNVVRKKGTRLDGNNPTLLTGYGGYGVNTRPSFGLTRRTWVDAGGVFVDANIRGGGEYGDEWHRAGNLTHKQNVFDDFHAVAQELKRQGYADRKHLAIYGASNGGLLMGAELVQHPEAWRAVVSMVGIYDMLKVEGTPNGAFNVTEFGTVKDPAQFKALYAYSPYHHVQKGAAYPAALFMTGDNDPRVDPWHSRKMVARLQAANSSGAPILLRTSGTSGHGIGSAIDEIIAERVDMYSFLFAAMGMKCCAIPAPPPR